MISAVVFGALGPLVSGRAYPNTFPQPDNNQPMVWPAIRYTFISHDPIVDICGTDDGDTDDSRVQLDVVAKTYGAMDALRSQVRTAMDGLIVPVVRQQEFETFDTETKTHRAVMEYLFTPSSPAGSP